MSTIERIDNHTSAGERRTALAALLAEQGTGQEPQSEPCLTAEQLAWLVGNPAAGPEQESCFEHLAACDRCYRQWLELSRIMAEEQGKATVTPLFTAGRLAWAGSFLAAAASVVLFLNIQQDASMPVLKQTTTVQGSLDSAELTDSMDIKLESPAELVPQTESMAIEESIPAADAAPEPAAPTPAPPYPSVEAPVKKEKKSLTNAYQAEPTVQSLGMELESMVISRGGLLKSGSKPVTAADWLTATSAACNRAVQGEYISRRYWQEQYFTGKKLLSAHQVASFSSDEQKKQVEQRLFYLQLLADGDQLLPLCETILNQPGTGDNE